jgi:hypothetical protein
MFLHRIFTLDIIIECIIHNKNEYVFFYFSQDTSDNSVRFHLIGVIDVHTYK